MHINRKTAHMSLNELRALVNGKFQTRKCNECDGKGWYYVHADGTKRDPNQYDDVEDFIEYDCESSDGGCDGLGYNLIIEVEDEPEDDDES